MASKLQRTSLLSEVKWLLHVSPFPPSHRIQSQAVRRQVTVTTDNATLNRVTAHAKHCVTHGLVASRKPGKQLGQKYC